MQRYFTQILGFCWLMLLLGCSQTQPVVESTTEVKTTPNRDFTIYLVRHGKTLFNTTDQVQGWSDTPLTPAGEAGAKRAAEGLNHIAFDLAFSSDLGRARTTANLILAGNFHFPPDLIEMTELREIFYGSYEGKPNFEMMKPLFQKKRIKVTPKNWENHYEKLLAASSHRWMVDEYHRNDPTHTAETYQQVFERTEKGIKKVVDLAMSEGAKNILVVTHGDQIAMVLAALFPELHNTQSIPNNSLTLIHYRQGQFVLEKVGDLTFLPPLDDAEK